MPLNLPFPGFATALGPSRALARLRHERAAAIVLQGHGVEILEMRPEGLLAARLDGEVDRSPAGGVICVAPCSLVMFCKTLQTVTTSKIVKNSQL